MRKMWLLGLLSGIYLLLTACATEDASVLILDDYGDPHYTPHHLTDKVGQKQFPLNITKTGHKLFVFDPKIPAWAAYDEDGSRIITGRASGGGDYCEDTNTSCRTIEGTFKVYRKGTAKCVSGEFPIETNGGAKMPYCMYFYRGFTIHSGYEFSEGNTSHGCIRVLPSAAKWLNESFMTLGTQVVVLAY
ncbi:MAG: L,D-transpeptidase [Legionella sp.]|nr:L,D-transpeptidase [Legionella sp.]